LGNVAELLKMPVDEILGAKDDCGVPTYMLQLNQMAALYGHLTASDRLDLERIVRAMVAHPELIAGDGYFDTELMRLSDGEIVSKTGAEGIQCVGRVGEGMGLAVKVVDGSKRAKYAATLHILQQLGWITPTAYETLSSKFLQLSLIVRLDVVGDLQVL
jgi:L-asparaginase